MVQQMVEFPERHFIDLLFPFKNVAKVTPTIKHQCDIIMCIQCTTYDHLVVNYGHIYHPISN